MYLGIWATIVCFATLLVSSCISALRCTTISTTTTKHISDSRVGNGRQRDSRRIISLFGHKRSSIFHEQRELSISSRFSNVKQYYTNKNPYIMSSTTLFVRPEDFASGKILKPVPLRGFPLPELPADDEDSDTKTIIDMIKSATATTSPPVDKVVAVPDAPVQEPKSLMDKIMESKPAPIVTVPIPEPAVVTPVTVPEPKSLMEKIFESKPAPVVVAPAPVPEPVSLKDKIVESKPAAPAPATPVQAQEPKSLMDKIFESKSSTPESSTPLSETEPKSLVDKAVESKPAAPEPATPVPEPKSLMDKIFESKPAPPAPSTPVPEPEPKSLMDKLFESKQAAPAPSSSVPDSEQKISSMMDKIIEGKVGTPAEVAETKPQTPSPADAVAPAVEPSPSTTPDPVVVSKKESLEVPKKAEPVVSGKTTSEVPVVPATNASSVPTGTKVVESAKPAPVSPTAEVATPTTAPPVSDPVVANKAPESVKKVESPVPAATKAAVEEKPAPVAKAQQEETKQSVPPPQPEQKISNPPAPEPIQVIGTPPPSLPPVPAGIVPKPTETAVATTTTPVVDSASNKIVIELPNIGSSLPLLLIPFAALVSGRQVLSSREKKKNEIAAELAAVEKKKEDELNSLNNIAFVLFAAAFVSLGAVILTSGNFVFVTQ